MFGFFKQKPVHVHRNLDLVWRSMPIKLEKICIQIDRYRKDNQPVLLLAHQRKTLSDLCHTLKEAHLSYQEVMPQHLSNLPGTHISTALVDTLNGRHIPREQWQQEQTLQILVLEHHPFNEPDATIESFASTLPYRVEITWFVSLDDPVFNYFSTSGNMDSLVQCMDDETPITHKMINKSIARLQKQLEKEAAGNPLIAQPFAWLAQRSRCSN